MVTGLRCWKQYLRTRSVFLYFIFFPRVTAKFSWDLLVAGPTKLLHMLQQMVLTKVTKARQEKNGLAWSIVFWEHVPISPMLGLLFQKDRTRVKFWFGKIIYTAKFTRGEPLFFFVTCSIFVRAMPKIVCSVNGALGAKCIMKNYCRSVLNFLIFNS